MPAADDDRPTVLHAPGFEASVGGEVDDGPAYQAAPTDPCDDRRRQLMAQATVMEAPAPTLAGLLASPVGRQLLSCIQCGTCAGTCPYGEVMRNTPRRLIGMLREGFIEEVIASDDLLSCVTCYDCWRSGEHTSE